MHGKLFFICHCNPSADAGKEIGNHKIGTADKYHIAGFCCRQCRQPCLPDRAARLAGNPGFRRNFRQLAGIKSPVDRGLCKISFS